MTDKYGSISQSIGNQALELAAEKDIDDMKAKQDRDEYTDKVRESQSNGGRNAPRVPKSMLEREYVKSPSGGYTHK